MRHSGIKEQMTELNNIINQAIKYNQVTIEDIRGRSRHSNIVAVRVWITKQAYDRGIDLRMVEAALNKDRGSVYHYLYRFRDTFEYELVKYKIENEGIF